jgi:hypothetical protein
MSKVKEGMSRDEVRALLGPPDDVRTEHDAGWTCGGKTKEIWCYGSSGHLTAATLGEVYIDKEDRVQLICGQGNPPEGLPSETELRRLLEVLNQAPSYSVGSEYNPRKVIEAVNVLQPLGKEKALAVMEEFLRVARHSHDGRRGVFLVLRTLFDVPENPGYMPKMYVGQPSPAEPEDKKLLPRFPIALEGDTPFLVVFGYMAAGMPEPPEWHVAYFREHGQLRAKPLAPSTKPFETLEALERSPRWNFRGRDEHGRHMLRNQVLRLLDSVYRVEPQADGSLLPWRDEGSQQRILREASALKIRWEPKENRYTFLDETHLPDIGTKHYRREIWKPDLPGQDVEVIIERRDLAYVQIEVFQRYEVGKAGPKGLVGVFKAGVKDKPIAEIRIGWEPQVGEFIGTVEKINNRATMGSCGTVKLTLGTEIQAQFTSDGKTQTSPVYKP